MPFFKKTNCLSLNFFLVCTAILGLLVSSCCHNKTIPQLNYPLHLTYAQFADDLYTGDIILFHGDTEFDKVTDSIVRSPWAHVGMIIKDKKQNTYLWEATVKSNGYDPKDFSSDSNKLKFLQKDTRLLKEQYFKPVMKEGVLSVRLASD